MTIISDKTSVTISLVLGLVGGAFWLSSVFFEVKAHSKDIDHIKTQQQDEMQILIEIRERIIKLETEIKRKL